MSSSSSATTTQDRSLLTIILDITPTTWGERELKRNASDRKRFAENKRSVGPAKLDDIVSSTVLFCGAYANLHRDNCLVIIGVACNECAVLYPRKGGGGGGGGGDSSSSSSSLANMVHDPSEMGSKIDMKLLHDGLKLGVAELVNRAAAKAEKVAAEIAAATSASNGAREGNSEFTAAAAKLEGAAIAAGVSLALCIINRFMVASHGGVSALTAETLLKRREDEGVLALIEGKKARKAAEEREERRRARGMLSPRVLIIQACDDRTKDYNALMNCAFASIKGDIVIDGCFIPSGISGKAKTSIFLEQACDRTGGLYLAVPQQAQVGGSLAEVLITVFLPPLSVRKRLHLPALTEVDFSARCFETGESVDIANVCNQCLSIFKNKPREFCPTCGAECKNGNISGSAGGTADGEEMKI